MAIMSKQKGDTHFWVPPGIYSAYSSNIRRFLPGCPLGGLLVGQLSLHTPGGRERLAARDLACFFVEIAASPGFRRTYAV